MILLKPQPPQILQAGEEHPSVQGGAPCRNQDVRTEGQAQGQARGWGACWPPAFPLSFSIMLIWLLLVTATLHYYYSFQALNHYDGYNLTSTNLPNSAPLHFFNTKDKIGRFSNWLCNFLFSSPPALAGAAAKASCEGPRGEEVSCPLPVRPRSGSDDRGFALSWTP